jgi:hypothetical protein
VTHSDLSFSAVTTANSEIMLGSMIAASGYTQSGAPARIMNAAAVMQTSLGRESVRMILDAESVPI